MSRTTPVPATGAARRRKRLSDEETERRMLGAAVAMVNDSGLTVSLEHIGLEDVIREAGVSRSAVYRRWPYKDLFFSDLLKELAGAASPAFTDSPEAAAEVSRVILDRFDWLEWPEYRPALAAEALRRGALAEFRTFGSSPAWRTYFALHATFLGLADGELRDEVQAALAASERALTANVAHAYRAVAGLLGLRPRPETGMDYEMMAQNAAAMIRGLVLMAPANPGIGERAFTANPYGAPEPAEWSQPAAALAAVTAGQLEVDPAVEWDAARMAMVRGALVTSAWVPGVDE